MGVITLIGGVMLYVVINGWVSPGGKVDTAVSSPVGLGVYVALFALCLPFGWLIGFYYNSNESRATTTAKWMRRVLMIIFGLITCIEGMIGLDIPFDKLFPSLRALVDLVYKEGVDSKDDPLEMMSNFDKMKRVKDDLKKLGKIAVAAVFGTAFGMFCYHILEKSVTRIWNAYKVRSAPEDQAVKADPSTSKDDSSKAEPARVEPAKKEPKKYQKKFKMSSKESRILADYVQRTEFDFQAAHIMELQLALLECDRHYWRNKAGGSSIKLDDRKLDGALEGFTFAEIFDIFSKHEEFITEGVDGYFDVYDFADMLAQARHDKFVKWFNDVESKATTNEARKTRKKKKKLNVDYVSDEPDRTDYRKQRDDYGDPEKCLILTASERKTVQVPKVNPPASAIPKAAPKQKPEAKHGAAPVDVKKVKKGMCRILNKEGVTMGKGFSIGDKLNVPDHVVDTCVYDKDKVKVSFGGKEHVVKVLKRNANVDVAQLTKPPGMSSLPMGDVYGTHTCCVTSLDDDDEISISFGTATRKSDMPDRWSHRTYTVDGWSGSPLLVNGVVVGMHVQGGSSDNTAVDVSIVKNC